MKRGWLLGIWKMIPWPHGRVLGRNQRIFEGKARSYQEFKLYFLRTLYNWSQVLDDGTNLNLLNFIDKITYQA